MHPATYNPLPGQAMLAAMRAIADPTRHMEDFMEATEQTPDPRPGRYYVTAQEQGGRPDRQRTAWLAGPFSTHAEALHHVPRVQELTCKHYAKQGASWLAYGTARIPLDYLGRLPSPVWGRLMGTENL